jgi:MoaA/NifB/PqqE/SkfB family radical SAM enzyme
MDSFCILPFIQIAGKTSGTYRLCCTSPDSNIEPIKKMGEDKIASVWNNDFYKSTRLKMLTGEKVSACETCYKAENCGGISRRLHNNKAWKQRIGAKKFEDIKSQALKNNGFCEELPMAYDLRLGNLCNLKCRMCNSMTSTTFAKEWQDLRDQDINLEKYSNLDELHKYSKKLSNWFEEDFFWDDIEENVSALKRIYLTGGEPTLIKRNNEFLEKLIEFGKTDVEVVLNSNIMAINKKFLDTLEKFERVSLSMSIDGIGKVNDYIRHPSKWDKLEKNINLIFKRKIGVDITFTVSAYNFFDLKNFISWFLDKATLNVSYIDWNFLEYPNFLSVSVLPINKRREYINELNEYLNEVVNESNISFIEGLKANFNILLEEDNYTESFPKFINYSKMLDKHRNEKLMESIPALSFANDLYGEI